MTTLFKKPTIEPKKYLAELEAKILIKTKALEGLDGEYEGKKYALEEEFSKKKAFAERELFDITNALEIKRTDYAQKLIPITERSQGLDEREKTLLEKEGKVLEREQGVFEREHEVESKLSGVQDLADELGETRIRLKVKEKTLDGREKLLKDNEDTLLLRIERFSHEVNESSALLQERVNEIELRELNIKSNQENLAQREVALSNGKIRLADREATLARAWKELKTKYGRSTK